MGDAAYSADFAIIDGEWDLKQVTAVLEDNRTEFVVVAAAGHFYVVTRREALPLVIDAEDGSPATEIFGLADRAPAPTYPPDEAHLHSEGVVVDPDGAPLGVVLVAMEAATGDREPTRSIDLGPPRSAPADTAAPVEDRGDDAESLAAWEVSADFPNTVEVDSVNSVVIELCAANTTEPGTNALPIAARVGETIDLVVQAKDRVTVEGRAEASIVVGPDALPVQVKLRAVETGEAQARVLVFKDGVALGAINITSQVVPAGTAAGAERVTATAAMPQMQLSGPPDLNMLITEEQVGSTKGYSIRLNAADPSLGLVFKEWRTDLRSDPRTFVNELFKDIESLKLSTRADRERAGQKVAAKGASLFDQLFPEDLRVVLWSIRERISRIQINSEEPWIPWELVRLSGEVDGRFEEGRFLCEFDATRWIPGGAPKEKLSLDKIGVIMPSDSGLSKAVEERAMIHDLAGDGRTATDIPANASDVLEALAAGEYTALHFSGHGSSRNEDDPNRSRMMLENDDALTPDEISGRQKNLGLADPIVFLNACQIGRSGDGLTDLGGWANKFIDAGAAAFVGGLWNVHDGPAFRFASKFYAELANGADLADAAKASREAIRNDGDATWLAYTVYGYPGARVA